MNDIAEKPMGRAPSAEPEPALRLARTAPASAARPGAPLTEGRPPETIECVELAARNGCHLSADQVWRLLALRQRVWAGGLREPVPEQRADARLRFARWLYQQGRISG
jgi:hypothetical protein